MIKFIGTRLVQMFFLFLIMLTAVFFLLQAQPGDIAQQFIANPSIPPEAQEMLRARLGLDKPLWQQYLSFMKNYLTLNMGVSFREYPTPVADVLLERLPRTLVLFLSATVIAYYIGFTLGKLLAWKRGGIQETTITVGGVMLYTVFYPWYALIMIWVFAFVFGLVPVGKFITPGFWRGAPYSANVVFGRMIWTTIAATVAIGALYYVTGRMYEERRPMIRARRIGLAAIAAVTVGFWLITPMRPYATDILHHTLLPVLTLASVIFAGVMLLTRSSMLETLKEDYILTARAKGLPSTVIRDRHAARNALLPVVTSLVLALAFVIGGGIITESVFSWPGMGEIYLTATLANDIPVVIGALAFIGILALLGHLVVDILYMYLDPRIRYS